MYQLIRAISMFVRQYYIPNPFESTGYVCSIILNLLLEPFLQAMTYAVVGIFYKKRSNPALGSFLYLIFYSLHTGLIMLIEKCNWNKIAIVVITVIYASGLLLVKKLIEVIKKNKD